MLRNPRWKPHLRPAIIDGEGAVLVSESENVLLPGDLAARIAPLLDGTRSREQLAAELGDEAFESVLAGWESEGYLCEGAARADENAPQSAGEAVFWSLQDLDSCAVKARLGQSVVRLASVGEARTGALTGALRALGIEVCDANAPETEGSEEFVVVLADDYARDELGAWNERALRRGQSWMLARLVGSEIWLGPVFVPDQSACWACLCQRLRVNRDIGEFVRAKTGHFPLAPQLESPLGDTLAAHVAALEIARWIARGESSLEAQILTLDTRNWRTQHHAVTWRPQCPACGYAPELEELSCLAPRVEVRDGATVIAQDGGYRTVSPEATLEKFQHHISPICGAVTRLERQQVDSDGIIHNYAANHNFAVGTASFASLRMGLRARSGGKGSSDIQARVGGLCEALERYCGVFRGEEPRRRARLADLGDAVIPLESCLLFSESQYQNRAEINVRLSNYQRVPARFDEKSEIEWSPVWSLTQNRTRWLPTAFCYFLYPFEPGSEPFCYANPNGNAAGNTLEEAILQGFFELAERDSVALWWLNRLPKSGVDLDSFEEPYFGRVRDFLRGRGRDLWLLDLTADLGIPAFVAVSRVTDSGKRLMIGLGCHLDARIAALRAVTELNQMLTSLLREERAPATNTSNAASGENAKNSDLTHWLETATLGNQPYLAPINGPLRVASDFRPLATGELRDDVEWCRRAVEARGMEMLVLDQTRADIGLPVAKVIVPGMRHFWTRTGPGRLYDVPVALGWLSKPLAEADLNPIPIVV